MTIAAPLVRRDDGPPMHEASPAAGVTRDADRPLLVLLHARVPGRLRVAVKGLRGAPVRARMLQAALGAVTGVQRVKASSTTGNLLVLFEEPAEPDLIFDRLAAVLLDGNGSAGNGRDRDEPAWHLLPVAAAARGLDTTLDHGLTSRTARARLREHGRNQLQPVGQRSPWQILLAQFTSAPVFLLAGAALVSCLTGALLEAAAIASVIALNGAIGYVTESRAEKTIRSLGEAPRGRVPVLRDGSLRDLAADELVPGDVIMVRRGDIVPADARLARTSALSVSEAALTGESLPVVKSVQPLGAADRGLSERRNMIYRGTVVTGGDAVAMVVATGARTELGRVQRMVDENRSPETPMQRKLAVLGTKLVWITAAAGLFLLVLGRLRGLGLLATARTALAMTIAALPEGLPMVATTGLAVGASRLRARNVHVRRLEAIETLGSVDVVCFDKTGTLTLNEMSVVRIGCGDTMWDVAPDGTLRPRAPAPLPEGRIDRLFEIACLCREADPAHHSGSHGSSTEAALVRAAAAHGADPAAIAQRWPLRATQHRTEAHRFMATSHADGGRELVAVKGSPLELLQRCSHEVDAVGGTIPLSAARRDEIASANAAMARDALRVLGFAYAHARLGSLGELAGLTWIGLAGLADPIRPGADVLVAGLHRAGIHTIMVTGDQPITACAIARQIGLAAGAALEVLDGQHLDTLAPDELAQRARRAHVLARVSPAQKLHVVRALQRAGAVVAMLGDGINDGPALRAADVGVSIGAGGEAAARQIADATIADDDPRRLLDAIEHGRSTAENIRKSLRFLIGTNSSEVLLTVAMTGAGVEHALTPLQLLWINLITDVLPGVGIAYEAPDPGLMVQPPLVGADEIVRRQEFPLLAREASILAAGPLAAGLWGLARHGRGPQASTMMFASLITAQLLHAFRCRAPLRTVDPSPPRPGNQALATIVLGSMLLHLLLPAVPLLRRVLGLTPIGWVDGLVTLGAGLVPVAANLALDRPGAPSLAAEPARLPALASPPLALLEARGP